MNFNPVVMRNANSVPFLVFARGRKLYRAVTADTTTRIVSLESLRGLVPIERRGKPYPPRRAASFWLNHSNRTITRRAKAVLRGLVARRKQQSDQRGDLCSHHTGRDDQSVPARGSPLPTRFTGVK